jgi:hypothetical protein
MSSNLKSDFKIVRFWRFSSPFQKNFGKMQDFGMNHPVFCNSYPILRDIRKNEVGRQSGISGCLPQKFENLRQLLNI